MAQAGDATGSEAAPALPAWDRLFELVCSKRFSKQFGGGIPVDWTLVWPSHPDMASSFEVSVGTTRKRGAPESEARPTVKLAIDLGKATKSTFSSFFGFMRGVNKLRSDAGAWTEPTTPLARVAFVWRASGDTPLTMDSLLQRFATRQPSGNAKADALAEEFKGIAQEIVGANTAKAKTKPRARKPAAKAAEDEPDAPVANGASAPSKQSKKKKGTVTAEPPADADAPVKGKKRKRAQAEPDVEPAPAPAKAAKKKRESKATAPPAEATLATTRPRRSTRTPARRDNGRLTEFLLSVAQGIQSFLAEEGVIDEDPMDVSKNDDGNESEGSSENPKFDFVPETESESDSESEPTATDDMDDVSDVDEEEKALVEAELERDSRPDYDPYAGATFDTDKCLELRRKGDSPDESENDEPDGDDTSVDRVADNDENTLFSAPRAAAGKKPTKQAAKGKKRGKAARMDADDEGEAEGITEPPPAPKRKKPVGESKKTAASPAKKAAAPKAPPPEPAQKQPVPRPLLVAAKQPLPAASAPVAMCADPFGGSVDAPVTATANGQLQMPSAMIGMGLSELIASASDHKVTTIAL